jgi:hypothetical protein
LDAIFNGQINFVMHGWNYVHELNQSHKCNWSYSWNDDHMDKIDKKATINIYPWNQWHTWIIAHRWIYCEEIYKIVENEFH